MKHPHRRHRAKLTVGAGLLALAVSIGVSHATIILSLTDTDGSPNSTIVAQGSSFTVTVKLTSTSEQTTGLSYFLEENGAGNPHLQITGRNIAGSFYPELTTSNGQVLSFPGSLLNPRNDYDLGGGITDLNSPVGAGTFFVADITLLVLPSTPLGTYILAFSPNSVAAGPGPDFAEIAVNTFSYNVVAQVPEPGSALFLGAGSLLLGIYSRRRSSRAKAG